MCIVTFLKISLKYLSIRELDLKDQIHIYIKHNVVQYVAAERYDNSDLGMYCK